MTDGWAPALAAGPGERWVSADEHSLHIWSGNTLERSADLATLLGGPPRFLSDGSVLAGRYEVDPDTGTATERLSLDAVLEAYDPQGDPNQLVVRAVAWTADGRHALLVAEYRPTRLKGGTDAAEPGGLLGLSRADGSQVQVLDRDPFPDAAPVAGDRWLCSGGSRLRAFDPDSGELVLSVDPDESITALATVGDAVVAGLANGDVIRVDVPDASGLRRWSGHEAVVDAVALSPDAQLVASGDRDGALTVTRAGDDAEPVFRTTVAGRVDGLCFLSRGHLVVAVGGAERELRHIELDGAH